MKNRTLNIILLQFVFLSHLSVWGITDTQNKHLNPEENTLHKKEVAHFENKNINNGCTQNLKSNANDNQQKTNKEKKATEYYHFKKFMGAANYEFSYGRYAGSIGDFIPKKLTITTFLPKMEFYYKRIYFGVGIMEDFQTQTSNIYYQGKSYAGEFYVNTRWDAHVEAGYNFWFKPKSVSTFTVGYRKLEYSIYTIKTGYMSDRSFASDPKYANALVECYTKSITTGLAYSYLLFCNGKETFSIMAKTKYNLTINIKYDNEQYHGTLHEFTFGILFMIND